MSEEITDVADTPTQGTERSRTHRILLKISPILLPLGAVTVTAVLALNISRVFLASSKYVAVGAAAGITLGILIGASLMSYAQNLRTSSLTLMMAMLFGATILAGSVTLGAAEHEEEEAAAGFVEPQGEPVQTLVVDALPTNKFQATEFTVTSGITRVFYDGKGGTHTLVFERGIPGFLLEVAGSGSTDEGKVDLRDPSYTIYCTIPGHREAGMEAELIVSADAPPINPPDFQPN